MSQSNILSPALPYDEGWSDEIDEVLIAEALSAAGVSSIPKDCPPSEPTQDQFEGGAPMAPWSHEDAACSASEAAPCPRPPEISNPLACLDEEWPPYVPAFDGPADTELKVVYPPCESSEPAARSPIAAPIAPIAPNDAAPLRACRPFPKLGQPLKFPALATRSALFKVGGLPGETLSGLLESTSLYELTFEGPRLSMRDKQIWEAALAAAQKHGWLDSEFKLALSVVADSLGLKDRSKKALRAIFNSLNRLANAKLSIRFKDGASANGPLLASVRQENSRTWIAVDATLVEAAFAKDVLFEPASQARKLISTDLGLWLLDYAWVNEQYDKGVQVNYLWRMSGSSASLDGFMKHLRKALAEVSTAAPDVLMTYAIKRIGRDARDWEVTWQRGPKVPAYKLPRKERSRPATAAADAKAPKRQKRSSVGGIAL